MEVIVTRSSTSCFSRNLDRAFTYYANCGQHKHFEFSTPMPRFVFLFLIIFWKLLHGMFSQKYSISRKAIFFSNFTKKKIHLPSTISSVLLPMIELGLWFFGVKVQIQDSSFQNLQHPYLHLGKVLTKNIILRIIFKKLIINTD